MFGFGEVSSKAWPRPVLPLRQVLMPSGARFCNGRAIRSRISGFAGSRSMLMKPTMPLMGFQFLSYLRDRGKRPLGKFRSLSLVDCYLLLWAGIVLPLTSLRLRRQGLQKVYSWAAASPAPAPLAVANFPGRPPRLGKLVNFVALHGLYKASCLCRSLVLLRALRREGFEGELRIGVPDESHGQSLSILDAHAWVECQGRVINDRDDVARRHSVFDFHQHQL